MLFIHRQTYCKPLLGHFQILTVPSFFIFNCILHVTNNYSNLFNSIQKNIIGNIISQYYYYKLILLGISKVPFL